MIRLLPPDVRSCLRSGIATPSLAQCVEELVLNSVDAEATCIAVRVDIPNCKIQVVDNGKGLTKEDLELVGNRYATSKCHQLADLEHLQYFGYRGEALASISHISSILEIVSRAKGTEVTLSKMFRNAKPSKVFEAAMKRPSVGTTVTVHSAFYNLPVRRKMISASLDYERVCQRMEGLALIHPRVSFTLRNDSTGIKSIQTHATSSLVNSFRLLFGQGKARSLKEVNHQLGKFSISGYMGEEGHPNKNLQFVYVNHRLVLKTRLHKAINYLLRKSLIAHYRPRFRDRESPAECTNETQVMDRSNSPGRAADQYGIFVLNIKCPLSEYDICLEPSKSLVQFKDWSSVLQCIEQLVNRFLTQENLMMKVVKEKQENSPDDKCKILTLDDGSSQEDDGISKDQEMTEWSASLSQKYGRGISASDCSNTLQSLTVRRPLRKSSNELMIQSSEREEASGTEESFSKVDSMMSGMPEQDDLTTTGITLSPPHGNEDPGVEELSEKHEDSDIMETTRANLQPLGTDTDGKTSNLKDDSCSEKGLPKTLHVAACEDEQNTRLEIINPCSPNAKGSPFSDATSENCSSHSQCITVSSGLSDDKPEGETAPDSEETVEAASVIFSLSENEGQLENLVRCQQFLPPNCQIESSDRESLHSPGDAVCETEESLVNLKDKNSDGHASVCDTQQKQVDTKTTDTIEGSNLEICKERNPNSTKAELELKENEPSIDLFITPTMTNHDILTEGSALPLVIKHQTSATSSDLSYGTSSRFDSESETSDSYLLLEKDETTMNSSKIMSPEIMKDSSENVDEVDAVPEDKTKHHFIALDSCIRDSHTGKDSGSQTLSSPKHLDRLTTSSLQIFRRSIQAKSDWSVRRSISDLLHGKDAEATSRCFAMTSVAEGQTRFTTTSPIVLKRRFTPGLMMFGKEKPDERPVYPKVSSQTSVTKNKNAIESVMSAHFRNSKFENKSTRRTTHLSASYNSRSDDLKTDLFSAGPSKHPQVMMHVGEKSNISSLDPNPILKEQGIRVCVDGQYVPKEKMRNDNIAHTSGTSKPNLKRLRQETQALSPSNVKVKTQRCHGLWQGRDIQIQQKSPKEKKAQQTKMFMSWESFLQTVPPLRHIPVTSTENLKGITQCGIDPLSTENLKGNNHQDKLVFASQHSNESDAKLTKSGHLSPSDKVDITPCEVSKMQIHEKNPVSEESISLRNLDLQKQFNKSSRCLSEDLDGRGSQSHSVIHPCPPAFEESTVNATCTTYSNICQEKSVSPLSTPAHNLPISVVPCNTTNFNLQVEEVSGLEDAAPQCVLPLSESGVYSVNVCNEFSRDGSTECSIHDADDVLLSAGYNKIVPSLIDSFIPSVESIDVDSCAGLASGRDLGKRDRDIDITEGYLCHSPCSNFIDAATYKVRQPCVDHPMEEQDLNQEICPKILTDIYGKRWNQYYDAKLKKQVYIDLNTGNCSFETPVIELLGSRGDGMVDEETKDTRNDSCVPIVPTGRKKSHLHQFHSMCAQPFLSVSQETSSPPDEGTISCLNLSPSSHSALIHMVDDHLDHQDEEVASKWRGECPNKQSDDSSAVEQLFDNWTNPMFSSIEADILDARSSHMPRSSIRAQNMIHPYKFTKEMFQDIKVVGQVDNKFIACMVSTHERNQTAQPNLLVLIDQHAAHERIRLEQLTSDVFEDPGSDDTVDEECAVNQACVKSSSITPAVRLSLPYKELRLLHSFSDKLERLGISHRIIQEKEEDNEYDDGNVEITRLPACLVEREAGELKRGRQPVAVSMVQALLAEHLEVLQKTSGASAILPKTITRVLNSQACHGAIKFGDQLDLHECLSLIGQLSHCDLPFQCAHGRPSLVPLFDMKVLATNLQDKVYEDKPRLSRLRHSSR